MHVVMPASRADSGGIHAYPYTKIAPEMTYGLERIGTVLSISTGIVFVIACGMSLDFYWDVPLRGLIKLRFASRSAPAANNLRGNYSLTAS